MSALLHIALPLVIAGAAEPETLRYTIDARDYAQRALLHISVAASAGIFAEDDHLCTGLMGAGAAVEQVVANGATLAPTADDPDCFGPLRIGRGEQRIRYTVSLARLQARRADPDYAVLDAETGTWLINDQAVLLRPEPVPSTAKVTLALVGPAQSAIDAVWGARDPFTFDGAQLDGGAYFSLGGAWAITALPPIEVPGGGQVSISRLAKKSSVPDATLRAWIQAATDAIASVHGRLPGGRLHVFLVADAHQRDAGVFGTILRRRSGSAVLYYGAHAQAADFTSSWLAMHELFHTAVPHIRRRPAWFVEGVPTYYQDVMRSRLGLVSPEEALASMDDGNRRFCQPRDGQSLAADSAALRTNHLYQRVYWGGACLAMRIDLALRKRSSGKRSLDSLLRELMHETERAPLDEAGLIARLDAELGEPLVATHLAQTTPITLPDTQRVKGSPLAEILAPAKK